MEKVSISKTITLEVTEDWHLKRLDAWLSAMLGDEHAISRGRVQSLIKDDQVTCIKFAKKKKLTASLKVETGQIYEIIVPPPENLETLPEDIPLTFVHEDDDMIIVNKQAGLSVHPSSSEPSGTLVNALLFHRGDKLSGINGVIRPGIVHRIDKQTTGLIVVAKHDRAHQVLAKQFEKKSLSRTYYALIWDCPLPRSGTIEGNIGRHPYDRKRMTLLPEGGKPAVTHFKVIETFNDVVSLVKCNLETGRTHQIRVHFKHKGYPLIGDPTYGKQTGASRKSLKPFYTAEAIEKIMAFNRQALHAKELELLHPQTKEVISYACDLPADMLELIDILRNVNDSGLS